MDIRPTTRADIPAVDALLARAYPVLLKPDYPASVLVTALPLISRAQPGLVTSGTYYGVFDGAILVGAGGWSMAAPGGASLRPGVAHVRHVVTDPARVRQGIGRAMMERVLFEARSAGAVQMACQATRTAVPFYAAMGFLALGEITVPLRGGIDFPAVQMKLDF
ncbi:GNAT family acetyltransferase [Litoreibacter ponti]|uniref:GNAT family acetyltransferase n=1 Tax=Litoreibacter ponti TaxID=1510457 RepID=A0A2T6BDM2_9RHOB|nr:GNAT family N-acetyltransferase [Litoreibacter ponti]PTX54134.1 GNAT family acetyltransferase [Litoreibacter ponti]